MFPEVFPKLILKLFPVTPFDSLIHTLYFKDQLTKDNLTNNILLLLFLKSNNFCFVTDLIYL